MVDLGKLSSALTSDGVVVVAAVYCPSKWEEPFLENPFQEVFWVKIFCPRKDFNICFEMNEWEGTCFLWLWEWERVE